MKKAFQIFLVLFVALNATSCFDITEEVTLRKDGSGIYATVADASKLISLLEMGSPEMKGQVKPFLDSTFFEMMEKYKSMTGISNVKLDTSKFGVYRVTMNFNNVTALNSAINSNEKEYREAYSWEKGKLTRFDVPFGVGLDELKVETEEQKQMMEMINDIEYKIVWKLPVGIKTMSNELAELSPDKLSATLKVKIFDIMSKKVSIYNEITY